MADENGSDGVVRPRERRVRIGACARAAIQAEEEARTRAEAAQAEKAEKAEKAGGAGKAGKDPTGGKADTEAGSKDPKARRPRRRRVFDADRPSAAMSAGILAPAGVRPPKIVPKDDEILVVVLGGCDAIGMNMTMYGHAGKWLVVDAGCAFPDEDLHPGLQSIVADPEFLEENLRDVVGMIVTHAHEDHIGAIQHLWPRLPIPIHGTPFALEAVRNRLVEKGTLRHVALHAHKTEDRIVLGPFDVRILPMAHSIPEATALAIRTPIGTVLHTGDWKLDPVPLVGPPTDLAALRRLGDEGVLAMTCDSTNAMTPGRTPSEDVTRVAFEHAFADRRGAIAVACFSSNIARLKAVAIAAAKNGRKVALSGRSLIRMEDNARKLGHLAGVAEFIDEAAAAALPKRMRVVVCTGTQGEERSALSRMAAGEHRHLRLLPGDTVIYSARRIPGNEERIAETQERLRGREIEVLTPDDGPVHVSGHPSRDDLARMFDAVRPRHLVPVHGSPEHLAAHAELAASKGLSVAPALFNGAVLRLTRNSAEIAGRIEARMLAWDGAVLSRFHPAPHSTEPSPEDPNEEDVLEEELRVGGLSGAA